MEETIPEHVVPEFDGLQPVRARGQNASLDDSTPARQRAKNVTGAGPNAPAALIKEGELEEVLSNAIRFKALYAFSLKEHTEENLEFLALVRYLNPEAGASGGDDLAKELLANAGEELLDPKAQMKWIYKTYVNPKGDKQVNLNAANGTFIKKLVENNALWIKMFNNGYNEIFRMFEKDAFGDAT